MYVLSGVIHFPLRSIDVYSIWLLKAKAFYLAKGFPLEFFRNIGYSHPQYPVLLPWLSSLIYRLFGEVNEYYVLIFYPFVYVLILFLAYKFFTKFGLNKLASIFFVYLYSMFSPLLAQAGRHHAGTADIILTLLFWIGINIAFDIVKNKKTNLVWAIALIVAVASQVKLEGVFFVWLILFLPLPNRQKLFWAILAIIPSILWFNIRTKLAIPATFVFVIPSFGITAERTIIVIQEVVREMLNIRNWYIFWIIFALQAIVQKSKDKFFNVTVQLSLILIFLMFFSVYLLAEIDPRDYVPSSIDRIMLQLSPFWFSIFVHRSKMLLNRIK